MKKHKKVQMRVYWSIWRYQGHKKLVHGHRSWPRECQNASSSRLWLLAEEDWVDENVRDLKPWLDENVIFHLALKTPQLETWAKRYGGVIWHSTESGTKQGRLQFCAYWLQTSTACHGRSTNQKNVNLIPLESWQNHFHWGCIEEVTG